MNVILSIKPQFVEEIVAGRKLYEFRKQTFKQPVSKIYIYATSPICRIVGEFRLGKVIEGEPEVIWSETYSYSGISKDYFDLYFSHRQKGYAIEIKCFKKYVNPINPYKLIRHFKAPQSFCYIENLSRLEKNKELEIEFE